VHYTRIWHAGNQPEALSNTKLCNRLIWSNRAHFPSDQLTEENGGVHIYAHQMQIAVSFSEMIDGVHSNGRLYHKVDRDPVDMFSVILVW
jgi:hypothetical protein